MKLSPYLNMIILLLIGLIISSCATLDKNECLVANWESIGFEDGAHGYPASRIGQHRTACAKHSVTPDLTLYTKGRRQGLVQYCRASVGYQTAVSGRKYKNVCSAKSEGDYLHGYHFGQRIYKLSSRIHELEHKIRKEEKLFDKLTAANQVAEAELIKDGVSRKRRAMLLGEIKHLAEMKHEQEDLIARLVHRLKKVRHRMRRLQARNPYEH